MEEINTEVNKTNTFLSHMFSFDNDTKNELRTDKLILFPEERTAETDKKVTITTPKGNTVGVGMHADLNKELFKLLSRVKGVHNVN